MSESAKDYRDPRPRLIIADDHRLVVAGLSRLLGSEYDIVGTASSGEQLLALLPSLRPDCVLVDLHMPGGGDASLVAKIASRCPSTSIIVVTIYTDRYLADAAVAAGASGFVPKEAGLDELQFAIAEALAGRRYVSSLVPKTSHRTGHTAYHLSLHRLTPRQQQVISMLGLGHSSADISRAIGVSPSTVTFHKQSAMRVLGIRDEASLIRFAVLASTLTEDGSQSRRSTKTDELEGSSVFTSNF